MKRVDETMNFPTSGGGGGGGGYNELNSHLATTILMEFNESLLLLLPQQYTANKYNIILTFNSLTMDKLLKCDNGIHRFL